IDGYALSKKVEYHQVIGRAVRNDIINYPSINDYVVDLENSNNELSEIMSLISSGELEISELKRLGQKKEQLKHFYNLLNNNEYFSSFVVDSRRPESVWQKFFEENKWIFGFGLNYVFNTSLEGKKLEQVVEGYSISNNGKRIDALMHSNGLIQSLCFAEIKTHLKPTLRKSEYRPGVWSISDELTGGVAQVQRTVQQSINNLQTGLMVKDENGYSTGGKLFLYNPKAFLIIGSLAEFKDSEGRVHEGKFSSFQLFRRSISDVEIITFDELYERAHALVNNTCL
ncbi:DUF4263 domain-containing protein, partial [Vibrio alginolyticus]|nr:DUF4263 domain-containing protein [Vibrio alginolyticus]